MAREKKLFLSGMGALVLALLAGACGGGGGGGDPSGNENPLVPSPTPFPTAAPTPGYETPYPYVDVLHSLLAYDESRRLIYAYVPFEDAEHPRSFAIVDVDAHTIEYTAPVAFVPFTMVVSPDGRHLWIGTADTNEIVKLALPDFSIELRIDLGTDAGAPPHWEDGRKFDPGHIAISPTDPDVFAVSLIDNRYWTCAVGLRVYDGATMVTQLFENPIGTSLGNILSFDGPDGYLTTLCSGTYPDIVTRLAFDGSALTIIDSQRGASGVAATLGVHENAILTGAGSKWDMPAFSLRGSLPPFTSFQQGDPAPLLWGCVFADEAGGVAACLSHTDFTEFPTERAFVLYELIDANALLAIPLDQAMTRGSRILKTGVGEFAVSVAKDAPWLTQQDYRYQQTRIYFLNGIDAFYP